MKISKSTFVFLGFLVLSFTTRAASNLSSASVIPKTDSVSNVALTKDEKLKVLQMQLFAKMTISDYEKLKGKKLNFFERVSFKLSQHRAKRMLKYYEYGEGPTTLQKISWLLKGLLLGPIALLLGYIFLKDDDRELIKWIWFGFAGFAVIVIIILLTI